MPSVADLLQGIVVETKARTYTGGLFYSDTMHDDNSITRQHHILDYIATVPILGIAAGVIRIALSVIHMVGHLFAALFTLDKGHLYHVAKGGCEFLRGLIQSIPIAGHIYSRWYNEHGEWWIIKIYNPDSPDTLDDYCRNWNYLKQSRPNGYVVA